MPHTTDGKTHTTDGKTHTSGRTYIPAREIDRRLAQAMQAGTPATNAALYDALRREAALCRAAIERIDATIARLRRENG